MVNIGNTFGFGVITIYTFYHQIMSISSEITSPTIVYLIWVIYYMLYVIVISGYGHAVHSKVISTLNLSI